MITINSLVKMQRYPPGKQEFSSTVQGRVRKSKFNYRKWNSARTPGLMLLDQPYDSLKICGHDLANKTCIKENSELYLGASLL